MRIVFGLLFWGLILYATFAVAIKSGDERVIGAVVVGVLIAVFWRQPRSR